MSFHMLRIRNVKDCIKIKSQELSLKGNQPSGFQEVSGGTSSSYAVLLSEFLGALELGCWWFGSCCLQGIPDPRIPLGLPNGPVSAFSREKSDP